MPTGPRVRANNVYGAIEDNPLLIGAVSFTSLGLNLLPAISSQHAVVVLDPKRVFGAPEIVVVTSHLASGTTATITRGQYGTAARQHPTLTAWAHVPIDEDYTAILTSSTRPANPYRGQMIFETDTEKFVARSMSDTWQDAIPLGQWTAFTATPTPTAGSFTTATGAGRFCRVGRIVHYQYGATVTTVGTGTGDVKFTLPVAPQTAVRAFGYGREDGIGGGVLIVYSGGGSVGQIRAAATLASGQVYNVAGTYEAAS